MSVYINGVESDAVFADGGSKTEVFLGGVNFLPVEYPPIYISFRGDEHLFDGERRRGYSFQSSGQMSPTDISGITVEKFYATENDHIHMKTNTNVSIRFYFAGNTFTLRDGESFHIPNIYADIGESGQMYFAAQRV